MSDAISISELSLSNDLKIMQSISHNVANLGTQSFKRDRVLVSDFSAMLKNAGFIDHGHLLERISGEQSIASDVPNVRHLTDFSPAALKQTGRALDVAIEGDGFFEVATNNGVAVSRGGSFTLDSMGRLVVGGKYPLQGMGGEIRLLSETPKIDSLGRIWDGENFIAQLKIVNVKDLTKVQKVGEGLYLSRAETQALDESSINVRQGFVEDSNVKPLDEMILMMKTVRHLEMTQRLMRGYDDMLGEAISTIADF